MLYVLYEVLSGKPVGAMQREQVSEKELVEWLDPYRSVPVPVLATLSDGENRLMAALKTCWPQAPHQRCQVHFLNNLMDDILDYEDELRRDMRQDLGGLTKVPQNTPGEPDSPPCDPEVPRDPGLIGIETHVRQAIRDALNRSSRKPFEWGGLHGYEQLEAIVHGLEQIQETIERVIICVYCEPE